MIASQSTSLHRTLAVLVITFACGALGWPAGAHAQQTTGSVQGTVKDAQGGAIPDADVELVNEETGTTVAQKSGGAGRFAFNYISPGRYTLTARAPKFRPAAVTAVLVEVTRTTMVELTLEAGGVSEVVEVTASRPFIDTSSAQVSTSVRREDIDRLPSLTRSALELAELAPGVDMNFDTTAGGTGQNLNIEGTRAFVNGNRGGRNGFYLDGVDNTGAFRNSGLNFPNPDTVQELQVSTSNTSAEFGRQPGGNFNVITKSGTNQLRGTGSYFFRTKQLNANSWANNRAGAPKPDDDLKTGAVTLGGPIRRDRTFFFSSYMAFRDNAAGQQNSTRFPTEAMRRGDFSGVPVQLLDPDTRAPLAGNQIPSRLMDPVAVQLAALMPTVANYNDRFFWAFESPARNDEFLLKLDHHQGAAHAFQVSTFTTWGKQTIPNQSGRPSADSNIPAWGPQLNTTRQITAAVRHTWILTPRVVIESRASMARLDANRDNPNTGRNLADFGAQNYPLSQDGARRFLPHLTIASGPNARNGFLSLFDQGNYQAGSSVTWARNTHNVKAGYEVQRQNVRQYDDTERIHFTFDGRLSAGTSAAPTTNQFAFAYADFLMGRTSPVATYSASGILDYDVYNWNTFAYVQDDWRVTSRLTITPGLRYELYFPPHERDQKQVAFIAGHQSTRFPSAPVNIAFAGDRGLEGGFFRQDRNNLAPRLGVAYDVLGNGRLAVRGGIGWYYSYNPSQFFIWTAENNPWRPEVFGSGGRLSDPWLTSRNPVYSAAPTPLTNANIANFSWVPPFTATGFAEDFDTPYSLQGNLSVERELTRGVSVTAGYVGNRGRRFTQILPINFARYADGANDTTANIDARRPIASFRDVFLIGSTAKLWYDALQLSGNFRRSWLDARATYVLARGFDTGEADPTSQSGQTANPLNPAGERGENQRRHTFRVYYAFPVPFFREPDTLLAKTLGGWQVAGSFRARAGQPLNVTLGRDWNYDGVTGDRPDQAGEIDYLRAENPDGTYQWVSPSSFAQPGGGTDHNVFGTLPRNAVVGPGDWNADLALLKDFRFSRERRVQVRFEAYNVFNNNNLANPVLNMSNVDFGRITTRRDNRRVQLGVRLSY